MNALIKIVKYQVQDILRSKWMIAYTIFFFLFSYSIFFFSDNFTKAIVGLMNLVLLIVPLVSLVFGTIYLYNNKDYTIFMLSQPIKREILFFGLFAGIVIPLSFCFLAGVSVPSIFFVNKYKFDTSIFLLLIAAGVLQTFIFLSISFFVAIFNENKLLGLGLSLFIWLLFEVVYDGIILMLLNYFQDFPLEKISLAVSFLNPVDLARIILILKLDIAALMGYTGAVFQMFFSKSIGVIISISAMIIWFLVPLLISLKKFIKKDF